jgi:hypothetical protein
VMVAYAAFAPKAPAGGESLGPGDLTTEFAIWLRTVEPWKNEEIHRRLKAHYGTEQDLTYLLVRFLRERQ